MGGKKPRNVIHWSILGLSENCCIASKGSVCWTQFPTSKNDPFAQPPDHEPLIGNYF